MKIEIIGHGPITPAQLDEILFGASTINRKNPLEEAMDKLLDDVKHNDEKKHRVGPVPKKTICFDIQSITANHKKNAFTVVWADGSHTIVHLQPGDVWDDEKALAMCFVKHMMGDTGSFNDIFTEEMPAKIKHIGKVEPVEEKCDCDGTCTKCTCQSSSAVEPTNSFGIDTETARQLAEAATTANNSLKEMISAICEMTEPVKVKRYDLFLMDPCGDRTEIYHQGTDAEIHKAMRAYRMQHYPILEANRTPYRVWVMKDNLMVDFGAGSYFIVPGMDHDTFVKGK